VIDDATGSKLTDYSALISLSLNGLIDFSLTSETRGFVTLMAGLTSSEDGL
jgi:hypothetical protein